jgi:hypothetical protein
MDRPDPSQDLPGQQPTDPEQLRQRRARLADRSDDQLAGCGDAGCPAGGPPLPTRLRAAAEWSREHPAAEPDVAGPLPRQRSARWVRPE